MSLLDDAEEARRRAQEQQATALRDRLREMRSEQLSEVDALADLLFDFACRCARKGITSTPGSVYGRVNFKRSPSGGWFKKSPPPTWEVAIGEPSDGIAYSAIMVAFSSDRPDRTAIRQAAVRAITDRIDGWSDGVTRWGLDHSLGYRLYPLPDIARNLAEVLDQ